MHCCEKAPGRERGYEMAISNPRSRPFPRLCVERVPRILEKSDLKTVRAGNEAEEEF
jgi:hypothetical protein